MDLQEIIGRMEMVRLAATGAPGSMLEITPAEAKMLLNAYQFQLDVAEEVAGHAEEIRQQLR